MKNVVSASLAIGLGLTAWFLKSQDDRKQSLPAKEGRQEQTKPQQETGPFQTANSNTAAPSAPQATAFAEISEAEFRKIFSSADLVRSFEVARVVEKLESSWKSDYGNYFCNMLDSIGEASPSDRRRLLFLANEIRSKDFVPYWSKLLERDPPAYENESELINSAEPSESSLSLRGELAMAVQNLGLLAYGDELALKTLQDYVTKRPQAFDNAVIRKNAYESLREVNPSLAALSYQGLAKDDPLRDLLAQ